MFWPCETRTSTCRSFATISSGLYRFLAIAVPLDVKDIPQIGPLQWGWINASQQVSRKGRKYLQAIRLRHFLNGWASQAPTKTPFMHKRLIVGSPANCANSKPKAKPKSLAS